MLRSRAAGRKQWNCESKYVFFLKACCLINIILIFVSKITIAPMLLKSDLQNKYVYCMHKTLWRIYSETGSFTNEMVCFNCYSWKSSFATHILLYKFTPIWQKGLCIVFLRYFVVKCFCFLFWNELKSLKCMTFL